jgi:diaminopimelate epimerase
MSVIKHTFPFRKMNGLGNDFAVLDGRAGALNLNARAAQAIADRGNGIGCDQVIVLEPSSRGTVFMRILNADGSEVSACGNATRCVAGLVAGENNLSDVVIETRAGLLHAIVNADGTVSVDMGTPRFGWQDIPLSRPFADTAALDYTVAASATRTLSVPGVVNVGNPHCIFFVDDIDAYNLADFGPRVEHDPLFPERVNVSLAQIMAPDAIRLAVWERGAGITKACGTGACAAAVASARRRFTERRCVVSLPGGNLTIEWRAADDHILMTGPWTLDYEGVFEMDTPATTN